MRLATASGGGERYRVGQNADINVTPFVDVMLVLLIIFMVAIPATQVSVKLDLPQAAAGDPPKAPTYISLTDEGRLYIGDLPTTLPALTGDLGTMIGRQDRVYIRADRSVRYDDFMAVMNTLRDGGFERVGLMSEEI
jgi:biopolymer transport protein ExbD